MLIAVVGSSGLNEIEGISSHRSRRPAARGRIPFDRSHRAAGGLVCRTRQPREQAHVLIAAAPEIQRGCDHPRASPTHPDPDRRGGVPAGRSGRRPRRVVVSLINAVRGQVAQPGLVSAGPGAPRAAAHGDPAARQHLPLARLLPRDRAGAGVGCGARRFAACHRATRCTSPALARHCCTGSSAAPQCARCRSSSSRTSRTPPSRPCR